MNNLPQVITVIASVVVIAISSWALIYFSIRFYLRYQIRSQLGDMPSAEEIAKLYDRNNAIVEYRNFDGLNHSPTVLESPDKY
jgi:hypothetical protein